MTVVGPSHKLFSLKKFAYCACNDEERSYYNEKYETLKIDVKKCCLELLDFLKVKEQYLTDFVPYDSTTSEISIEAFKNRVFSRFVNFLKIKQSIIENAAQNGHVECMSIIASHGRSLWIPNTCVLAATNGQLEFLKHAHELGFPWSGKVIEVAAANNHLECIIYAHENGCKWTDQACVMAMRYGHYSILEYLLTNGCSTEKKTFLGKKGNTSLATNKSTRPRFGETERVDLEKLHEQYYRNCRIRLWQENA